MRKKYSFFCDTYMAIGMTILTLTGWVAFGFMVYWPIAYTTPMSAGNIFAHIFLIISCLSGSIFFTIMLSRFTERIVISEEGITIKRLYKKSIHKSYKEYPFFKIAYYTEFVSRRYFLVMCSYYLSPEELSHINCIVPDENCIKIKISTRRCRKLLKILPEDLAKKLKENMTPTGKFCFDAQAYMKRREAARKKKANQKRRTWKNKRKMSKTKRR